MVEIHRNQRHLRIRKREMTLPEIKVDTLINSIMPLLLTAAQLNGKNRSSITTDLPWSDSYIRLLSRNILDYIADKGLPESFILESSKIDPKKRPADSKIIISCAINPDNDNEGFALIYGEKQINK